MAEREKPRIVGPQEIAVLHGSPTSTAWRWKGRGRLPPASWRVSNHDTWLLEAIETWSRQTGRYQPAIRRWARHLDRGEAEVTFEVLYDLLQLGQEKTRVAEVGLPVDDAVAARRSAG
jgi:hypothetical protein